MSGPSSIIEAFRKFLAFSLCSLSSVYLLIVDSEEERLVISDLRFPKLSVCGILALLAFLNGNLDSIDAT